MRNTLKYKKVIRVTHLIYLFNLYFALKTHSNLQPNKINNITSYFKLALNESNIHLKGKGRSEK